MSMQVYYKYSITLGMHRLRFSTATDL